MGNPMKCVFVFVTCIVAVGTVGLSSVVWPQDKVAPATTPRLIEGAVTIVDLVPRKGEDGKIGKPLGQIDESEFTGPADKVHDSIGELIGHGRAIGIRQLGFVGVENRLIHAKNTEKKAYLMSVNIAGPVKGKSNVVPGTPMISTTEYSTGITVAMRAQIADDKVINLSLRFEDTRSFPPDIGQIRRSKRPDIFVYGVRPNLLESRVFQDGDAKEYQIHDFVLHSVESKLKIKAGHAVLVSGVEATVRPIVGNGDHISCPSQILLIVSANVIDPKGDANAKGR